MKDYLKENINFVMRTKLILCNGASKELSKHLLENSWDRIGLVVDKNLYENNLYARDVVNLLRNELQNVELLLNEMPEPTYDYLDKVKERFQNSDIVCFVAIGGGSTLDLSKGLATLKTNVGPALDYRGFGKVKNEPLPIVALPSTAGTGSEVTPYAVFIDRAAKWKFGINTEYNYPRMAFYDPRFLDSCPDSVYASAGMDAMTHALESFVAKDATFLSKMFSSQAFKLLFDNLKRITQGDRSVETKLNLLIGSGCAGIALMNAGAGPAGALSYPLGVHFQVPHGLAGSVFLPSVIKFNVDNGFQDYSQLYDLVFDEKSISSHEKSYIFSEKIRELSVELGIPISLKDFGVKSDSDTKLLIDSSIQLKHAFEQNPIKFKMNEIKKVICSLQ